MAGVVAAMPDVTTVARLVRALGHRSSFRLKERTGRVAVAWRSCRYGVARVVL